MARLSSEPHRVFERNMKKAKGLARLQSYIDNFLKRIGESFVVAMPNFAKSIVSDIFGTDIAGIEQFLEPILKEVVATRTKEIEEAGEKYAKAFATRMERHGKRIKEVFEEVDLLRERVLLEQAMVTAVTALEVYVQDVTVSAVKLNKYIEDRFHKQLADGVDYDILRDAKDSREALGLAVSRKIGIYHPNDLKDHFRQMLDKKAILKVRKDIDMLNRILAYRNLIVHKGGIIDAQFKTRTQYGGKLGDPVLLTRRRVENAIRFVEKLVNDIEREIRNARSPGS